MKVSESRVSVGVYGLVLRARARVSVCLCMCAARARERVGFAFQHVYKKASVYFFSTGQSQGGAETTKPSAGSPSSLLFHSSLTP